MGESNGGCLRFGSLFHLNARSNRALLESAKLNNLTETRALYAKRPIMRPSANHRGKTGETALHWAAGYGNVQFAELLVERGANVDSRSKQGSTPLHFACYNGHSAMVRLLIGAGANVKAENNEKVTPLHECCDAGSTECLEMLLKADASPEKDVNGLWPLEKAAEQYRLPLNDMFLKYHVAPGCRLENLPQTRMTGIGLRTRNLGKGDSIAQVSVPSSARDIGAWKDEVSMASPLSSARSQGETMTMPSADMVDEVDAVLEPDGYDSDSDDDGGIGGGGTRGERPDGVGSSDDEDGDDERLDDVSDDDDDDDPERVGKGDGDRGCDSECGGTSSSSSGSCTSRRHSGDEGSSSAGSGSGGDSSSSDSDNEDVDV
eukprot:TRINITY_DN5541_c0_g1_i2.p1 TRINITY_DN5541_c0_g1~~TRINITY_DN5541_c0_g1_i2.p1  ORF type:complete len:375 (-),score=91.63 TRINITY_DN5541_c0_g1_i2:19-1143(-)